MSNQKMIILFLVTMCCVYIICVLKDDKIYGSQFYKSIWELMAGTNLSGNFSSIVRITIDLMILWALKELFISSEELKLNGMIYREGIALGCWILKAAIAIIILRTWINLLGLSFLKLQYDITSDVIYSVVKKKDKQKDKQKKGNKKRIKRTAGATFRFLYNT